MNEQDDFFLSFKEQLIKDIIWVGLDPEPFTLSIWYGNMRRSNSWRQLPHVEWNYQKMNKESNRSIVHLGGWMLLYGGNWGDFHSRIMAELSDYYRSLLRDKSYAYLGDNLITPVFRSDLQGETTNAARIILRGGVRYDEMPFVGPEKRGEE